MIYSHVQKATGVVVVILIPFLVVGVSVAPIVRHSHAPLPGYFWPVLIGSLSIALLSLISFSRMRVEIRHGTITWGFGVGIPRFTLPMSEVASARVVRNPWIYGLGIHFIPRGTLYNVWGTAAVEITRRSGRVIRLGTDEPDMLLAAILAGRR
jgi:hypothetical protein